jgi:integrase
MGKWTKAGENLVRHWAGTYYLRAKVAGKTKRISLQTDDLRVAKLKRDAQLDALRSTAAEDKEKPIRTLADAVDALSANIDQPHLKESTRTDYKNCMRMLRESLPLRTHARTWSEGEAAIWWKKVTKKFSPYKCNALLRFVRVMVKILIDAGVRTTDPTRSIKRMRAVKIEKALPSDDKLKDLIQSVEDQKKRVSLQSAYLIRFLAYTGCRVGEARRVQWEDIEGQWLKVKGEADTGTKNWSVREVPISKPLKELLKEMRPDEPAGPLFTIKSPRFALTNACERMKIPHLTVHDLRRWFITHCIERGVDVPTIARWVGHSDHGKLLLKTYTFLQRDHSLKEIKKLQ